jgi:hypothetical protein
MRLPGILESAIIQTLPPLIDNFSNGAIRFQGDLPRTGGA